MDAKKRERKEGKTESVQSRVQGQTGPQCEILSHVSILQSLLWFQEQREAAEAGQLALMSQHVFSAWREGFLGDKAHPSLCPVVLRRLCLYSTLTVGHLPCWLDDGVLSVGS